MKFMEKYYEKVCAKKREMLMDQLVEPRRICTWQEYIEASQAAE